MMFKYPTEAQKASVLYLERVSNYKKLIIAGHSKGGNLSIYSGLHIENNIFKKIKKIYNLDGPGLTENLVLNKRNERRFKKMYLYAGQLIVYNLHHQLAWLHGCEHVLTQGLFLDSVCKVFDNDAIMMYSPLLPQ